MADFDSQEESNVLGEKILLLALTRISIHDTQNRKE
jgi:hypothetical protein